MAGERFRKSMEWLKRAEARVPGASQTFSKGANQFVRGASPLFLDRGRGARVWDLDGREYLDTTMALCAVSLGYADPDVDAAVIRQLERGVIFTLPHPLEAEVAELLSRVIPCAEMVRFGKNGSDATSGAVRLARAFTGRDVIAACGYHGWQDWYVGTTTRSLGVPKSVRALTRTFTYNRIETLEQLFDEHPGQVAAVIMEPVGIEAPRPQFLESVRQLCTRHGTLLIFDEIVTGFRFAYGGAQEHYGVVPDLAAYGKVMAGGFPLACVAGPKALMRHFDAALEGTPEYVWQAGTFNGNAIACAAGLATLAELRKPGTYAKLFGTGTRLRDGLAAAVRKHGVAAQVSGEPPVFDIFFTDHPIVDYRATLTADRERIKRFNQEFLRRGVVKAVNKIYVSLAHTDRDVDETLEVFDQTLAVIAEST